jgi:hypothetical protein
MVRSTLNSMVAGFALFLMIEITCTTKLSAESAEKARSSLNPNEESTCLTRSLRPLLEIMAAGWAEADTHHSKNGDVSSIATQFYEQVGPGFRGCPTVDSIRRL